jgi:hypothetical protein
MYEPFSVGAIVYTLFAWGTVFLLDPEHKAIQQDRQFKSDYEKEISNKKMEYLQSIQGEQAIQLAANEDIQEILRQQRNGKKNFGVSTQPATAQNTQLGFKQNNAEAEMMELRAENERLRNAPK